MEGALDSDAPDDSAPLRGERIGSWTYSVLPYLNFERRDGGTRNVYSRGSGETSLALQAPRETL